MVVIQESNNNQTLLSSSNFKVLNERHEIIGRGTPANYFEISPDGARKYVVFEEETTFAVLTRTTQIGEGDESHQLEQGLQQINLEAEMSLEFSATQAAIGERVGRLYDVGLGKIIDINCGDLLSLPRGTYVVDTSTEVDINVSNDGGGRPVSARGGKPLAYNSRHLHLSIGALALRAERMRCGTLSPQIGAGIHRLNVYYNGVNVNDRASLFIGHSRLRQACLQVTASPNQEACKTETIIPRTGHSAGSQHISGTASLLQAASTETPKNSLRIYSSRTFRVSAYLYTDGQWKTTQLTINYTPRLTADLCPSWQGPCQAQRIDPRLDWHVINFALDLRVLSPHGQEIITFPIDAPTTTKECGQKIVDLAALNSALEKVQRIAISALNTHLTNNPSLAPQTKTTLQSNFHKSLTTTLNEIIALFKS